MNHNKIITIIFGAIGHWKRLSYDNYGLIGAILGVLIEILGFVFAVIATQFY
ncbi:MAG: hypothetical protein V1769_04910 [Thermoplasmatota archaeon]